MQFKTCTFTKGQWHITLQRTEYYWNLITIYKTQCIERREKQTWENYNHRLSTFPSCSFTISTAVSAGMDFHGAENTILSLMQTSILHSSGLPRLPFFLNLITLKMWKMKLEVAKQTANSIHCIYGFYSRTMKHRNIYYFLIFCSRFCKSRLTYGKLLLIQSKHVWNLAFFLLTGDLFAEKFCELYEEKFLEAS